MARHPRSRQFGPAPLGRFALICAADALLLGRAVQAFFTGLSMGECWGLSSRRVLPRRRRACASVLHVRAPSRILSRRALGENEFGGATDLFDEDNEELLQSLMPDMIGDEVDIIGNGTLIKSIIKPAPAWSRRPQLGDEVTVHFVGSLEDGTVFDDSRARHEPYKTRIGVGFVIGGWEKALPTMMKGERAVFTMHPSIAYGEQGAGSKIPPNATVRFDIELLGWEELDDMGPDDVEPEWEAPPVGRDDQGFGGRHSEGLYSWERHGLEVIVKAQVPDDATPKDVIAEFYPKRVFVSVKGAVILGGTPGIDLEWEECDWSLHQEAEFEGDPQPRMWLWVHLQKKDGEKVRWPDYLLKEEDEEGAEKDKQAQVVAAD